MPERGIARPRLVLVGRAKTYEEGRLASHSNDGDQPPPIAVHGRADALFHREEGSDAGRDGRDELTPGALVACAGAGYANATMIFPERPIVRSRAELVSLIFELLDHNDAIAWKNDTAYQFLQGLAAWLDDPDAPRKNVDASFDPEQASWQLFADALQAAADHE